MEERLNLIINSKALNLLEDWLIGDLAGYSLFTPYQQRAYQPNSDNKNNYNLKHPLVELAIESDLVMEQIVKEQFVGEEKQDMFRSLNLGSAYEPETLARFIEKYARFSPRERPFFYSSDWGIGPLYGSDGGLNQYLSSIAWMVWDERDVLEKQLNEIENIRKSRMVDRGLYAELEDAYNMVKPVTITTLKKLEEYSGESGVYSIYPRYQDSIMPDVPSAPFYNLFKNRLRSPDQYRAFLEWVFSDDVNYHNFPPADKQVMDKLYNFYIKSPKTPSRKW